MTLTNAFESFMQDYITIVLGWAKWNGAFPEWNPVLDYAATPRMVMSDPTGQSGWDPRYQVPYLVPVVNARLGAAATLAANSLYAVANSPETPTSWRELWGCFCRYAATSRNEPGWTDPATWPADRLLPLHRNYLPEARAALAALTLAGVPGAAARHNWLKTRMDRQFPVCPGASYKWAVRPA
jgi:hypothetical protein